MTFPRALLPSPPRPAVSRLLSFLPIPWRTTDARFQHALDQMPSAAFFVVPRTGQFLAVNATATGLTGWTRAELLTQLSLSQLLGAGAGDGVLDQFYSLESGNTRRLLDVPLHTRAGRSVPVDLRLSALVDEERGEVVVLALAAPSDERRQDVRDRERHLRALSGLGGLTKLFAAPDRDTLNTAVHMVRDIFGADSAGLFRVMPDSPRFELEYGAQVPEHYPRVLGPSEVPMLQVAYTWAAAGPRPAGFLPLAAKSAGWNWFIAQPIGDPPSVVGALFIAFRPGNPPPAQASELLATAAELISQLIVQITRQRDLNDAQRLATHLASRLAAVYGQTRDPIVILNGSGAVDDLNGAAATLLEYRGEDVIGLPYEDVIFADATINQAITAVLRGGPAEEREGAFRRRTGKPFPALVRIGPLPAPEGGCALLIYDLTREQTDEIFREHNSQVAFAGQSIQAFAHEVRAPLNNISVGVQFLAARFPTANPMQTHFAKIQAECTRLSNLMNDMLAWAKPLDPKFAPLDLRALLHRLMGRWQPMMQQRNVRLSHSTPNCPLVVADARLIERVFINLIENALQAMPAGGQLSIMLEAVERGPQGTWVETRITDSGPGISEENRRRIFDPYFTTRPDGTGLGLAICKRLVTRHHGAISVESFPGAGTAFIVSLPAAQADAGDEPSAAATSEGQVTP